MIHLYHVLFGLERHTYQLQNLDNNTITVKGKHYISI